MFENGWLIEHDRSPVFNPMYLSLAGTQIGWSANSLKAVRFARFEDAKAFADVFLGGAGRCAEHGWGA